MCCVMREGERTLSIFIVSAIAWLFPFTVAHILSLKCLLGRSVKPQTSNSFIRLTQDEMRDHTKAFHIR